ncbi:MAG: nuclear transport factor 2 family protein [Candidatus Eisenbacteria bacterium]|nr:nuclear transport factor 2 family protein [Candidatus Eisenbacteria bacterium]
MTRSGMMKIGVGSALLLVLATRGAAADAGADADSVRALELARGRALIAADTVAISRMTAPEFVEISRIGQLRTKADNMRDIASGDLKLLTVKYDSTTVRLYGDVAILRAIATNTGGYRGIPFAGRIWYTRIFVKRDGRWQAVAMQHTSIP